MMPASWLTPGRATAAAGFLSVTVECTLLFSLFLQCIRLGASAPTLGLVMGACAVLPYGLQKVSGRIEGLLMSRINAAWIGCLLLAIVLALLLVLPLPVTRGLLMLLLCAASALCFLLFQLFETRLSMLCVDGRLRSEQANRYLQLAMTTGSALGGFLAGHVLAGLGLVGVGWVSALLLLVGVGCVTQVTEGAASSRDPTADRGDAHPEWPGPPTRVDLLAAFALLVLMCIAPAALNFLLPWMVLQENGWGPAAFGWLDGLAASGAFVAILLFDRFPAGRLFWAGVACFLVASACLWFRGSFPHLATLCVLWGLGMNLVRMRARQTFFLALQTRRDALLWSQRLGLTRGLVEAVVPVLLGLCTNALPGQLFAAVAWGLTAAVPAVAVLAWAARRRLEPVTPGRVAEAGGP